MKNGIALHHISRFGLEPLADVPGTPLPISRPFFREAVVDDVVVLDAERVSDDLCGQSTAITQLRQLVDKIAPTNSRVLITGPSGSGKEVTARLVHSLSRRANNAFIAVNCAMMAPDADRSRIVRSRNRGRAQDRPAGTRA